jgi:hypothetical protein
LAHHRCFEETGDYVHVSNFSIALRFSSLNLNFLYQGFCFLVGLGRRLGLRLRLMPAGLWRREGPPFPLAPVRLPVPHPLSSAPPPAPVMVPRPQRLLVVRARITARERVLNAR